MNWHAFDDGRTLGSEGSEQGIIILDEEHDGGARITLEHAVNRCLFTITCGVYGWMCHTRFFSSEREGRDEFDAMKAALANLVVQEAAAEGDAHDMLVAVHAFVERFP